MAFLQNITYNLSQKNIGSPQLGLDYVSGFVFTAATVPTGFSYSQAKQIFSVSDAEALGILGDYSDETKATATLTVTGTVSSGTIVTVTLAEPNINSDGWYFEDSKTKKLVEVTGTLKIEQK